MLTSVTVRLASSDEDLSRVAEMWTRSSQRLASLGFDQWQYPVKWENIRSAAENDTLWLVCVGADVVGTITLQADADPYWLPSDKPEEALYVHRMVVDDGYRGEEIGSALLDWAARRARAAGKSWVRLDAWKSNTSLHRYYIDRGFTLVRIDSNPNDPSGACFQRPSTIELGRGPDVHEEAAAA